MKPATRTPHQTKRHRGGTQPAPLTRDDILDAAMPLLARAGTDGLTVTAVAESLGISGPAVYHYVDGRNDLIDRLCERVAREVNRNLDLLLDDSMGWDDAVVAILLEMDRTFARYPGVAARVLPSRRKSRAADESSGRVRRLLIDGGYPAATADDLLAALQYLFGGWLLGTHNTDPAVLERSIRWLLNGARS